MHRPTVPEACFLPADYNLQHPELPAIREIDATSIDFAVLRNWLLHCQTHHLESCTPLDQSPLQEITGLKLIDCQTRQIVEAPRDPTFVALSYVWGQSHAAEATVLSRSLPKTVPRTIEDAIQVVLQLNLKYLWVDKYCIDQSNETELAQQISIMDMIYNAAFCTIVAACGEDASFGLPGVGLTVRSEQPAIRLNGQVWVSSIRDPVPVIWTSAWASRGWTYQEGLFSRRRFIFTEEQVYFECNRMGCLETVSYDLHYQTDTTDLSPGGIFDGGFGHKEGFQLHRHIEAYSRRSLSFQNDIINASSGVFRVFSRMSVPTYHYWGVPICYHEDWGSSWPARGAMIEPDSFHRFEGEIDAAFARGLCWQLHEACPRRPGFPSWSWTGWIGPLADTSWGLHEGLGDRQVKIWLQRTNGEYERLSVSVVSTICKRGPPYTGYTPVLRIEAWVIDTTFTYLAHDLREMFVNRRGWFRHPRYFVSVKALGVGESVHNTLRWPVVLSEQVEKGDEMHEEICKETFTCVLLSKASEFALVVRRRTGGIMERIGHVKISPAVVDPEDATKRYDTRDDADLFDMFPRTRRTILLG